MKIKSLWICAIVLLTGAIAFRSPAASSARGFSGVWQGTLKGPHRSVRIVLKITKDGSGGWTAELYSIDQQPDPIPVDSVALEESNLRLTVGEVNGSYEGRISADGSSIVGTWTQRLSLPLNFQRATKATVWPIDSSTHTVQFVNVEKDVKLEVLDWGGTGRPVVLLAGLGNTAHIFGKFAAKLATKYHVYGITRRGFGASSRPAPTDGNYSADRLGDDVLAVISALKLNRPVLVGHSIAGEELSSIGTRYPDKVSGLVYLDAGYAYAYYSPTLGDLDIDSRDLQTKLGQLASRNNDEQQLLQELLQTSLPRFEKDLREERQYVAVVPSPPPGDSTPPISLAILAGEEKYTAPIRVPILAIFAVPHNLSDEFGKDPTGQAAAEAIDMAQTSEQIKAFERGLPSARVIRLSHADHYVFISNETDVLREINAFIGSLP